MSSAFLLADVGIAGADQVISVRAARRLWLPARHRLQTLAVLVGSTHRPVDQASRPVERGRGR